MGKIVSYDYKAGKPDSVKYIPILSTLKVLLQHEDLPGTVYVQQHSSDLKVNFLEVMNFSVIFFMQFKLHFIIKILEFPIRWKIK